MLAIADHPEEGKGTEEQIGTSPGSASTHGGGATEASHGASIVSGEVVDEKTNSEWEKHVQFGKFRSTTAVWLPLRLFVRQRAAREMTLCPYHLQSGKALALREPSQLRRTSPTPQTNPRLWSLIISGRGGRRTIHGVVQVDGHGIGETRGGEIDNEGVRRISGWRRNTGAMSGGRRSNSFSVSHKGGDTRQTPRGRGSRA